MASNPSTERALPFSFFWPVAVGALAGIGLRLIYSGGPDDSYSAMAFGFVILAPIAVGGVTVFVAERSRRRTPGYWVAASFAATALFVSGTLLILIEGLICAVIIVPLFAALGILGGLIMGLICRFTNWPKQTIGSFVLLPLVLGGVDRDIPFPQELLDVERTVAIQAPAEIVWRELLNARDIRADEVDAAWLYRIGVPLPIEGTILDLPEQTRRVLMAKNVYFDELIAESRPYEHVRWTYRFYEDSFPPYALDQHVIVGGRYFDVQDTSYTLTRRGDATEVTMRIGFRVSTRFNWYASPVARVLIGNLIESNLGYYRRRSEAQGGG
jgi:hypothetical protein